MRVIEKLYREIDGLVFESSDEYERWIWDNYPTFELGSCLADPFRKGVDLMGYTSKEKSVWVLSENTAKTLNLYAALV